jgi:beta-hydroxylase
MPELFASVFAPKLIILYIFIASAVYVHYRGRVRHGFFRQLSDHSSFMAPYNALMYMFSAVPNRPFRRPRSVSRASPAARQLAGHSR